MTCDDVRAVIGEYAAGVLPGDERAAVEAHLRACAGCQAEVADLAATADALLELAPQDEPPVGFDTAVLDRINAPTPAQRPRLRRAWTAVAVAAAVVALGAGIVVGRAGSSGEDAGVVAATMHANKGEPVGHAYLHRGSAPWVLVDVAGLDHDGVYSIGLVTNKGVANAGTLTVDNGRGVAAVRVRTNSFKAVRITMAWRGDPNWYQCEAVF